MQSLSSEAALLEMEVSSTNRDIQAFQAGTQGHLGVIGCFQSIKV